MSFEEAKPHSQANLDLIVDNLARAWHGLGWG
jgi:hypothetical protein